MTNPTGKVRGWPKGKPRGTRKASTSIDGASGIKQAIVAFDAALTATIEAMAVGRWTKAEDNPEASLAEFKDLRECMEAIAVKVKKAASALEMPIGHFEAAAKMFILEQQRMAMMEALIASGHSDKVAEITGGEYVPQPAKRPKNSGKASSAPSHAAA